MGKRHKSTRKKKAKGILSDHQREGKVFLPPFLAKIGKFEPIRWADDLLPEMLWVALLSDHFPAARAVDLAVGCARASHEVVGTDGVPSFAFVSDYGELTAVQASEVVARLQVEGRLDDIRQVLHPLVALYAECPLGVLFDESWRDRHPLELEAALGTIKRVVGAMLQRRGRPAMIVQSTAVAVMLATGKMRIQSGSGLEGLNEIFRYPDTEESRKVASLVRAALNGIGGTLMDQAAWRRYFWRHGYEISVCDLPAWPLPVETEGGGTAALIDGCRTLKDELLKEIEQRWTAGAIDLSNPMRMEVLGGLIARQARLATAIAVNPDLWAIDVGRILLRCMVDTHITLTWLARNGTDRDFEHFIEYGLGQEKLALEHLRARLDETDPRTRVLTEQVEEMDDWINSQLLMDLLPVNVGSWTKKTVRDMAQECDCLEIYNLAYAPFSSVLHGTWNAIARFNLRICLNPLHKLHRVPSLDEPPLYLGILTQAVELMETASVSGSERSEWHPSPSRHPSAFW